MPNPDPVIVNGRSYAAPEVPVVVICLDGCEPDYLATAQADGLMPTLSRIRRLGTDHAARSAIPSFTNPNNVSIVTGVPPAVHGICGNFLLDPETGRETMMNDPRFLRAPSVLSGFFEAGARIAVVTAKDKLRALLGTGLQFGDGRAVCISSERAGASTNGANGLERASEWLGHPVPDVYSAELSEFVFAAGVKLLREFKPDLMYLSTSDYIQHMFDPDAPEAKAFHAMVDRYLGELDSSGAVIVLTADHGMKPKHLADGSPEVIYVQDLLDEWLGKPFVRVILPITDPYVLHHGALGSFATAYVPQEVDVAGITDRLAAVPGMLEVTPREAAAAKYGLPADRIGDIVMISEENTVIGTSAHRHDLTALKYPLRSHGGLSEQTVPFILNRRIEIPEVAALRNFDAMFYGCAAAAKEEIA